MEGSRGDWRSDVLVFYTQSLQPHRLSIIYCSKFIVSLTTFVKCPNSFHPYTPIAQHAPHPIVRTYHTHTTFSSILHTHPILCTHTLRMSHYTHPTQTHVPCMAFLLESQLQLSVLQCCAAKRLHPITGWTPSGPIVPPTPLGGAVCPTWSRGGTHNILSRSALWRSSKPREECRYTVHWEGVGRFIHPSMYMCTLFEVYSVT